ncbi:hypothetical protein [Dietzia lutea]|uniref:NAD-dependent epimerase/dehydratase domain-containing protein n=1 Tax=Dietzia lutea TaxID=546160 RepID=A0A2S1RAH9_9ACTN|nr:hypothetical protein [Dietzia lutea]AWH93274.1 hypothetical protein A6035_15005 [Dietzia lutea]
MRGPDSPFVFIWDTDLVAIIVRAVSGGPAGIYNVAGTGTLTIDQIAARLGKRTFAIPEPVLKAALPVGSALGATRYGPEQTGFLRYRPVLDNTRLREVFGYTPELTTPRPSTGGWPVIRRRGPESVRPAGPPPNRPGQGRMSGCRRSCSSTPIPMTRPRRPPG